MGPDDITPVFPFYLDSELGALRWATLSRA